MGEWSGWGGRGGDWEKGKGGEHNVCKLALGTSQSAIYSASSDDAGADVCYRQRRIALSPLLSPRTPGGLGGALWLPHVVRQPCRARSPSLRRPQRWPRTSTSHPWQLRGTGQSGLGSSGGAGGKGSGPAPAPRTRTRLARVAMLATRIPDRHLRCCRVRGCPGGCGSGALQNPSPSCACDVASGERPARAAWSPRRARHRCPLECAKPWPRLAAPMPPPSASRWSRSARA